MSLKVQMGHKIWMFVPMVLLFVLSQFYRNSSAVIASDLMSDLSLTATELGFVSSVFFYAFALIQIPIGAAMDLIGARKLVLFLSCVGILGAVIFCLAGTFPVVVLGRVLLGFGMASALMGTFKLLTIWYPPQTFATMSSVVLSIGVLGVIFATAPLAVAVDWMGWRKALLLVALTHSAITVWIHVVVRDRPEGEERVDDVDRRRWNWWKESVEGVGQVMRLSSFSLIALAAFVRYGTYVSIAGLWASPYLECVHGVSLVNRGKMLLAFPLGMVAGGPIFGLLSDRVFKNRKWVVVAGLSLNALFIMPLTGLLPRFSLGLLGATFFGLGLFTSWGPVMYANVKELVPSSLSGTAMTGVNFFLMLGAAVFQHGMGAVIARFSFAHGELTVEAFSFAFGLCLIAVAVGCVGYLFVKDVGLNRS